MTVFNLQQYCDLTPDELECLRNPSAASVSIASGLAKSGLMTYHNGQWTLTPDGRVCLKIANEYLSGQRQVPSPFIVLECDYDSVRLSAQGEWNENHLKALLFLTIWPDTAWRFLCSRFGYSVIKKLWDKGYIWGRPVRGAPQWVTITGLKFLCDTLNRHGVPFALTVSTEIDSAFFF